MSWPTTNDELLDLLYYEQVVIDQQRWYLDPFMTAKERRQDGCRRAGVTRAIDGVYYDRFGIHRTMNDINK